MKKLIIVALVLALLLPAAALAEDPDPIIGTWYMFFDRFATPEFSSNFPDVDYVLMTLTFTEDNVILYNEIDILDKVSTPSSSAIGKWEKKGSKYEYSAMMLGSGEALVNFNYILLSVQDNIRMRFWKLNPLDPYKDYVIR